MKKAAYLVALLAIVATIWFGIDAMGSKFKISGLLIVLLVTVPYFLGMGALAWLKERRSIRLMGEVLIALAVVGTYMLYSTLVLHPDAQNGLIFFVLPVYQLTIVLIAAAIAFVIQRRAAL